MNARDKYGWTPIHSACKHNNFLVVKLLLTFGLDVTLRTNKDNNHILQMAALNKDPKVIQTLMESKQLKKTDKNVTNCHGNTLLHFAAANKHSVKPFAYLIRNAKKFNLKINQLDRFNRNFFHAACLTGGSKEIVLFIIQNSKKYSIDLNLQSIDGERPFHYACNKGKLENVKILLNNSKKYKIDVSSLTNHGRDGQASAERMGHTDIVNLIKDWKKKESKEMINQFQNEILTRFQAMKDNDDPNARRQIADNVISLMNKLKENIH